MLGDRVYNPVLRGIFPPPCPPWRRVSFLLLATVCLFAAPANAQMKIGEINPISGAIGQYGTTCHRGITMAVEDANAQGGVQGQKIELITEDNQSQAGQAATIARKFVTQD